MLCDFAFFLNIVLVLKLYLSSHMCSTAKWAFFLVLIWRHSIQFILNYNFLLHLCSPFWWISNFIFQVLEVSKQVAVIESYLEQRGVPLPKGHVIGQVILPHPNCRCGLEWVNLLRQLYYNMCIILQLQYVPYIVDLFFMVLLHDQITDICWFWITI